MEVHHHPDLHHRRKKFREYFLEFIMIFLAVTLGFIAENLREYIADGVKAQEYAKSLYDDLKSDSVTLGVITGFDEWKLNKVDSLILLLKMPDKHQHEQGLYYYQAHMDLELTFVAVDITGQQLRNSGGMRYFKNPELYRAIAEYYGWVNFYIEKAKERRIVIPNSLLAQIFQTDILTGLEEISPDIENCTKMPPTDVKLIGSDKLALNEYFLYVGKLKTGTELSIYFLKGQIRNDLYKLMGILRKEFDVQ